MQTDPTEAPRARTQRGPIACPQSPPASVITWPKRLILNGYVVAVAASLAILGVLLGLQPIFQDNPPVLLFMIAVLCATWRGGSRAGFLATALGVLMSHYFLLEPFYSFHIADQSDQMRLTLFGAVGGLLSVAIGRLRQAERRALAAVTRHQERLAATQANAPIGLVEWALDGHYLNVNEAFCALIGYSREELLKHRFIDLTPTADRLRHRELFGQLIAGDIPLFQLEKCCVRKDGKPIWVHVHCTLVRNGAGQPDYVIGAVLDVSERKRAENQLRQSRQTLAELIERAPYGIYVVDAQFRIAMMNAGSQAGAFRNVRPVIGRDLAEALRILWPDKVAAGIVSHFRHTLETGESYRAPRFVNPRHDVVGIESYEWELQRMTLPDGQYGVICYFYDSTALREGEARLHLAKAAARLGIYDYAIATDTIRWDERVRELWGVEPDELISYPVFMAGVHPDDRAATQAAADRAFDPAGDGQYLAEFRVIHRVDRKIRWITATGQVSFDQGRAARMVGTVQDITGRKRMEEALRASEARLRSVTDNVSVGLVTLDRDRRYTFVNPAYVQILDLPQSADALIGSGPAEALASVYATQIAPQLDRAFAGEKVTCELIRPSAAGAEPRHYSVIYEPIREGGEIAGVIAILLDITERKRAEEALHASHERLTQVLAVEAVGVMFWDLNTGRLVDANDTFLKIMGYSRSDVEAYELTWQKFTPPEFYELSRAELRKFAATGRVGPYEKEYLRKDGTRQWLLFSGSSLGGNQCVEFCVDIADRKKAEEALRQSQEDLARAQEVGQMGWWRLDVQRNVLTWSAENHRLFGVPQGTPLSYESFLAIVHPDDRDFVDSRWTAGLRGEPYDIEHRIIVEGQVRWVRQKGYLEFDAAGTLRGGFGITQDITDRKRAEEALRAADRRKDEFLAMLAHELRNPLAPVRNAVAILKRGEPTPAILDKTRDLIDRQITHLARLVDDLLDATRIARGKVRLQRTRCDLAKLARDTLDDYAPVMEAAGLTLHASLPEGPLWLEADPTRLVQMLGNVLSNATKFSEAGGDIQIRLDMETGPERSFGVFTVKDAGIGIEPDMLAQVFEVFAQADRSLDRSRGGLGLGLALVKGLAELHGGWVDAASEGAGKGAEFRLVLPLAQEVIEEAPETERTPVACRGS